MRIKGDILCLLAVTAKMDNVMNWQKIGVICIFAMMALGGIGGVMLVGYTIIIRS